MPCYDSRENEDRKVIQEAITICKEEKQELENKINFLEAALCAICHELERKEIAEDILAESSRKGCIDLMSWWEQHKKNDESRLAVEIHKRYSVDEIEIIKRLLLKPIIV